MMAQRTCTSLSPMSWDVDAYVQNVQTVCDKIYLLSLCAKSLCLTHLQQPMHI